MAQKIIIPSLLAVLFTIIYSYHSLYRHLTFNSHALDLGIHTQAAFLFSQELLPFSSLLHMPYLADHFGVITFLLSPIYKIFPDAITLLIIQAIFVGLSNIPIYLIALDKLKSVILSLLISLSYLTAPSILSAINFDFHLTTISVLPLSLILASWYFKKWALYVAFLFFAVLFKEDVQIFIFGLGVYSLFMHLRRIGILTIIFSLTSFYLIKFQIMPFFWSGVESFDIGSSILPLSDPVLLVYLLITNPKIFIDQIFNSPIKLGTIDFVYRQFAFLPLLSPLSWLTVFPALFLRFSSTATHFWTSGFHYNANLIPFLAASAIFAIAKFNLPKNAISLLLIFFLITGGLAPNTLIWTTLTLNINDASRFSYINNEIKNLPSSVSISAQSPIVPHLANRERIYMYPEIYDAEYLVLDTSLSGYPLTKDELQEKIKLLKKSSFWKIVGSKKDLIIFKRN